MASQTENALDQLLSEMSMDTRFNVVGTHLMWENSAIVQYAGTFYLLTERQNDILVEVINSKEFGELLYTNWFTKPLTSKTILYRFIQIASNDIIDYDYRPDDHDVLVKLAGYMETEE